MEKILEKLLAIIESRTAWTIIVIFATNLLQVYGHYLTPDQLLLINGFLSALAIYFRITPRA